MGKKNCSDCGKPFEEDEMTRMGKGEEACYFCDDCTGPSFEEDVVDALSQCLEVIHMLTFDKDGDCQECGTYRGEGHVNCKIAETIEKANDVIVLAEV